MLQIIVKYTIHESIMNFIYSNIQTGELFSAYFLKISPNNNTICYTIFEKFFKTKSKQFCDFAQNHLPCLWNYGINAQTILNAHDNFFVNMFLQNHYLFAPVISL